MFQGETFFLSFFEFLELCLKPERSDTANESLGQGRILKINIRPVEAICVSDREKRVFGAEMEFHSKNMQKQPFFLSVFGTYITTTNSRLVESDRNRYVWEVHSRGRPFGRWGDVGEVLFAKPGDFGVKNSRASPK